MTTWHPPGRVLCLITGLENSVAGASVFLYVDLPRFCVWNYLSKDQGLLLICQPASLLSEILCLFITGSCGEEKHDEALISFWSPWDVKGRWRERKMLHRKWESEQIASKSLWVGGSIHQFERNLPTEGRGLRRHLLWVYLSCPYLRVLKAWQRQQHCCLMCPSAGGGDFGCLLCKVA